MLSGFKEATLLKNTCFYAHRYVQINLLKTTSLSPFLKIIPDKIYFD